MMHSSSTSDSTPTAQYQQHTVTVIHRHVNVSGTRNKKYLSFKRPYLGVLRLAVIISLLCGWVSLSYPNWFVHAREGYLTFSIIGFVYSIAVFILYLFNFSHLNQLKNIPLKKIILILDILFCLAMIGVSISCSIVESQLRHVSWFWVTISPYGIAAAFGFLSAVFFALLAYFESL